MLFYTFINTYWANTFRRLSKTDFISKIVGVIGIFFTQCFKAPNQTSSPVEMYLATCAKLFTACLCFPSFPKLVFRLIPTDRVRHLELNFCPRLGGVFGTIAGQNETEARRLQSLCEGSWVQLSCEQIKFNGHLGTVIHSETVFQIIRHNLFKVWLSAMARNKSLLIKIYS